MLATGRTDVTTLYVSMSARDPQGHDADYLAWHSLDHRPEQHRLSTLRTSLRLVSTPACRAARAIRHERFDATDHLMTYFFTDVAGLSGFNELSAAIVQAGRTHRLLPVVERTVYSLTGTRAAPRIKVGADVLPWWPAMGVYVLVEKGEQSPSELIDVPGVGGVWWGGGRSIGAPYATASNAGLQISYCFLDQEPVQVAQRLRPVLEKRWSRHSIEPLLAAPFHAIVPYEWDRFLP
jgi:hypothetical protein